MAGELITQHLTGKTVYFVIRNHFGQVWNTLGAVFEAYVAGNYTDYDVAATEQGASGVYVADFPSAIVAGVYFVDVRERAGGAPAQSDLFVGGGIYPWTKIGVRPRQDDQLWRRDFKKVTLTSTQLKTLADDGTTIETTAVVSDDGTTQTQNAGA